MADTDTEFYENILDTIVQTGVVCMEPVTRRAVRNCYNELREELPDAKFFYVFVHGSPLKGSKGDLTFAPGNERTYTKRFDVNTLERWRTGPYPNILDWANDFFREWGFSEVNSVGVFDIE